MFSQRLRLLAWRRLQKDPRPKDCAKPHSTPYSNNDIDIRSSTRLSLLAITQFTDPQACIGQTGDQGKPNLLLRCFPKDYSCRQGRLPRLSAPQLRELRINYKGDASLKKLLIRTWYALDLTSHLARVINTGRMAATSTRPPRSVNFVTRMPTGGTSKSDATLGNLSMRTMMFWGCSRRRNTHMSRQARR